MRSRTLSITLNIGGSALLLLAAALTFMPRAARSAPARAASCRGAVSWQQARTVVGRVTTIVGPVASTKYAASSNGSPTFLNLGVPYPDSRRVQVVIWIEDRAAFGRPEA